MSSLLVAAAMLASVAAGVPQELALQREQQLADVSYRLGFTIPATPTQPIEFADTISFDYSGDQAVLLDFAGMWLDAHATVNGEQRAVAVSQEHVVLQPGWLRPGTNVVVLTGQCGDVALNRQHDYCYTLFVPANARTAFPCFDQPSLKARFTSTLRLPAGWTSIDNGDNRHPMPTYLFSFTAGKFSKATARRNGRTLTALYRETDPAKVAQLPRVFDEVAQSLQWMERYTGIDMPWEKYGIVMIPGYQFGGMEHPGAIQLRARTIFVEPNATIDDYRKRLKLIAHETAHLWFGDLVTMRWFNDVWTKEVMANLMAAKICAELMPGDDAGLSFLKSYSLPAMSTDRTAGTHPIQQPLPNLNSAGLLYGNIIYDKAPVMMQGLEQIMGSDAFRQGMQHYLRRYSYGNATWDDLIAILDSVAPEAGVSQYSEVWVKRAGAPVIAVEDGCLVQHDPQGRGLVWPQTFNVEAGGRLVPVTFGSQARVPLPQGSGLVPNADGSGYGRFALDSATHALLMSRLADAAKWQALPPVQRLAQASMLYEHWLMHPQQGTAQLLGLMAGALQHERNQSVSSSMAAWVARLLTRLDGTERAAAERQLLALVRQPGLPAGMAASLKRTFYVRFVSPAAVNQLFKVWNRASDSSLTATDMTRLAWHLAIVLPDKWRQITAKQRGRITGADNLREWDFIAQACTPDVAEQQRLFQRLLTPEGRGVEPWVETQLALLCHETRGSQSQRYIVPALDALPAIQASSSIFFPGKWLGALLDAQRSPLARATVRQWIASHPELSQPLANKLKENAFYLLLE